MEVCPICLVNQPNTAVPQCRHEFCTTCLNEWRLQSCTCPLCRGTLKAAPLAPFFFSQPVQKIKFKGNFPYALKTVGVIARTSCLSSRLRIKGPTLKLFVGGKCIFKRNYTQVQSMTTFGHTTTLYVATRGYSISTVEWNSNNDISYAVKEWFVRAAEHCE